MTKEIKDMTLSEILNLDKEKYTDGEILDMVYDWDTVNRMKMDGVKLITASFRDALNHIELAFNLDTKTIDKRK